MKNQTISIVLLSLYTQIGFGGEPDHFAPKEHPPLRDLVRSADLVATTLVEVKRGVLIYRIDEVLKGEYKAEQFPGMYKGTYTLYTPAKEVPEATDKAVIIVKLPGRVQTGDDQLIMFLKDGIAKYPKITTPRGIVSVQEVSLKQLRELIAEDAGNK